MRSTTPQDGFFTSSIWPILALLSAVLVCNGTVCWYHGQEPPIGLLLALLLTPPSVLFGLVGFFYATSRVLRIVSLAAAIPGSVVAVVLLFAVVFAA